MTTYIALIRGLGGNYTIKMKDLVRLLEEMGLRNVQTYIASGNAVFQSGEMGPSELSSAITSVIEEERSFAPEVIILTPGELDEAIASNPYPEAESAPKSLHLTFLTAVPEEPDLGVLEDISKDSERFRLDGKVFYLHAPEGVGRSKLFRRIEKSLGVAGTARNWRSVVKISAIAKEVGG